MRVPALIALLAVLSSCNAVVRGARLSSVPRTRPFEADVITGWFWKSFGPESASPSSFGAGSPS